MQPWEIAISVGAVVGSLLIISGSLIKIYNVAKRIDGAVGLDDKGRTLNQRISIMERHILPNGGSSMTDKIGNIMEEQRTLRGEVDTIKHLFSEVMRADYDVPTKD